MRYRRFVLPCLALASLLGVFAASSSFGVTLTFDSFGAANTIVTNTDGSQYFNEFTGANISAVSGPGLSTMGNGSWKAAGVGTASSQHTLTVYGRPVTGGNINAQAFTGSATPANIRIRDIADIRWNNYHPSTSPGLDNWYLLFYTTTDAQGGPGSGSGGSDSAGWYGRRMTFEPTYAYNSFDPDDTWNEFRLGSGPNQVAFYDSTGPASTFAGFFGEPTLADAALGTVNWLSTSDGGTWPASGFSKGVSNSSASITYQDEVINLMRLSIGSVNSTPALLDGFTITLKGAFDAGADPNLVPGTSVIINFEDPSFVEPVLPEPSTFALLAVAGVGGMFVRSRRRHRASVVN